jgi:hypothetical protein
MAQLSLLVVVVILTYLQLQIIKQFSAD